MKIGEKIRNAREDMDLLQSDITADCITDFTFGDAIFDRYTAVIKPMGTPIRMAPAVP